MIRGTLVSERNFHVTAREWSFSSGFGCSASPQWVSDFVLAGANLNLNDVLVQAGRHFRSRVLKSAVTGSGTLREQATELSKILVGMMQLEVDSDQKMWVVRPGDTDLQRLCSELLGVGMGISVLQKLGIVDLRTMVKEAGAFDFSAQPRGGGPRIDLEFKGTVNGGAAPGQRNSIERKIVKRGGSRGYGEAIGLVFSGWTIDWKRPRGCDFEIMDPGEPREPEPLAAVQKVIRFYAERYDEIGFPKANEELLRLAARDDLLSIDPSDEGLLTSPNLGQYNRISVELRFEGGCQNFYGSDWEGRAASRLPTPPLQIDGWETTAFEYAYVGVDQEIYQSITMGRFEALLNYQSAARSFLLGDVGEPSGVGLVLSDGTVFIWSNSVISRGLNVEFI